MLTEEDHIMPEPLLSAIIAMDKNNLIGDHGKLPWHLPADLQYFKKTTLNHVVIMGRKTYCSIGKPLPMRVNIILTQDGKFTAPDCLIAHSKNEALLLANQNEQDEIFIIGGKEIYQLFLSDIKRFYITEIGEKFSGDTFFTWDKRNWGEIKREQHKPDEKNLYPYSFVIYERNDCS